MMHRKATSPERFRPSTFRARITLVMTLLALIILTLVDAAVYVGRHSMLQSNLDAILLSIAHTEAASYPVDSADARRASESIPLILNRPTGSAYETYVQIENGNSHVLARTNNLERVPISGLSQFRQAPGMAGSVAYADIQIGAQPMRCIRFPFADTRQKPMVALIAVSEEPMLSSLRSLTALLSGSLVLGGLAFALASSRLSLRLTRPLEQIAAFARRVEETSLHTRIPDVSPDTELRDVTEVLNEMLERLDTAFAQQHALVIAQQRFVADASHELRSPLTNLHGTVEVALRRPRTQEDYQETLTVALSEIQRLSRLVEDLLTLSRMDAGQFPLNLQLFDLGRIARDSVQVYAARAEQSAILFVISTPDPTPIYGDRDRLRQVVDNLLDNALKYAPPATSIEITTRRQGQECQLEVCDHGPGIPEADAAQIFRRFYRPDPSRTRASGGAGLGLAITQAIVQAHGGAIIVESIPGTETTFRVCLPATSRQDNGEEQI